MIISETNALLYYIFFVIIVLLHLANKIYSALVGDI